MAIRMESWRRRPGFITMTIRATWHDTVLAESESTAVVEGNHYFPIDDVKMEFLEGSDKQTVCPWKGRASYYTVVVDGQRNRDAAWYYPHPSQAASEIAGRVAFWRGVKVAPSEDASSEARGWRKLLRRSAA